MYADANNYIIIEAYNPRMDLDAMLDEAADAHFKKEQPAVVKKRIDPAEIRPFLAATALVTPNVRDKWTSYIRRDNNLQIKTKFLPSNEYQSGDSAPLPPNSNKILFEMVKSSTSKCGLNDTKSSKLAALVNPSTDSEIGKRLQIAYRRYIIESLKKDIESDINFNPEKFPNLATVLSKV